VVEFISNVRPPNGLFGYKVDEEVVGQNSRI